MDLPRLIAADGDHIVVAASVETTDTELRCGGGDDPSFGPPVLFVSDNRGVSFERVVPLDQRPLARLIARDGVFYGLAQGTDGGFAVVSSADGRTWAEVASATGMPHDLTASSAGLAVAHARGVLTSSDGVVWTDHELGTDGLYAPSVGRGSELIALGTASDGMLKISTDTEVWTDRSITGLQQVWQLIPTGDAMLVSGVADLGNGGEPVIGRIDLGNVEAVPQFRTAAGESAAAVLTPAGLLETFGTLSTVDANGVGAPTQHVDPFISAAVDGNTVAVLRDAGVAVSIDGGVAFGALVTLPLGVHEQEQEHECTECGRPAP